MTDLQAAVLQFETQWWQRMGDKDAAIRDRLGMEPERFYVVLDSLLNDPEAMVRAPATIARHRNLRERHRQREAKKARQRRSGGARRTPPT